MAWVKVSWVAQAMLAIYFQLVLWFPLGSWNAQPGKRLLQLAREGQGVAVTGFAFVMFLPLLLFSIAVWRRWIWLMWIGLAGYWIWTILQIQSWWIPWAIGADERAMQNQEFLENTYKLFSSRPGHPAPDAMHFILDMLLFVVVATLSVGLFQIRGRKAALSA